MHEMQMVEAQLNAMAWCQGLSPKEVLSLNEHRNKLDANITALDAQQKAIGKRCPKESSVFRCRNVIEKKIESEKKKVDFLVIATIENLIKKYEIQPAAYHGRKMNGINCRGVMKQTKTFTNSFKLISLPCLILTGVLMISLSILVNYIGTLHKLWTP